VVRRTYCPAGNGEEECRCRFRARRKDIPIEGPAEIFTKFAQEQMQAYASQAQELHNLIAGVVQKAQRA
jgi:hypothetical protein